MGYCRVREGERPARREAQQGVDNRVYGSQTEAATDTRPAGPGAEVHIIVTVVVERAEGLRSDRVGCR